MSVRFMENYSDLLYSFEHVSPHDVPDFYRHRRPESYRCRYGIGGLKICTYTTPEPMPELIGKSDVEGVGS